MACYPELANAYLTLAKEDATNNTKALQAPWSRSKFTVWCDTESILENPPRRWSTENYGGKVVGQNGLHISSDMGWRMIVVTWNILKLQQVRADPVGVSLRGKRSGEAALRSNRETWWCAIQERLSSSKGNLLDAKKSKQPWAWRCFMIFHMKTCVDKISLDTSSYCWNDMDLFQYLQSSCERIEDESNMMHFLSIAVNHFNELLSAEKSTLAFTHYDCPSVVGRSRAHRCACKHQSQGKRGQVLSTRILCNMEVFTTSQHLTDLTASPGWRKARWSSAEVPKIWVSWTVPKLSIHLR